MTVKELISELNKMPADAIVVTGYDRLIISDVYLDNNIVSFDGEKTVEDFLDNDEYSQFPDDVDETNYNPYMGCDDYDYDPAYLGWDI